MFDKPKKTLNKILKISNILFLIVSVFAVITFLTWTYSPNTIKNLDKKIPNFYILQMVAKSCIQMIPTRDFNNSVDLYSVKPGNSVYKLKLVGFELIVEYYMNRDIDRAVILSRRFVKDNPYEFFTKDLLIRVLEKKDSREAIKFLYVLNDKFPDIRKYNVKLAFLLKKIGKINASKKIVDSFNKNYSYQKNISKCEIY